MTRRFRCTVEYDGTAFFGFQRQPGLETVQGALERAIAHSLGGEPTVIGAGRTDAGVHAIGQVVHFDAPSSLDISLLQQLINDRLPSEIRIRGLSEVDASFHARFSAKSREYRYLVENGPSAVTESPGKAFHVARSLCVEAMDSAAATLCGTHDFALFGSPMVHTVAVSDETHPTLIRGGTKRTMWVANCWRQRWYVHFRFVADAYLRHMVRMMVGTLLRVGTGALKPPAFARLLHGDRSVYAGPASPAHGLYLVHIRY
jgi:tRNA pseudouridine38-40 synthase